MGRVAKGFMQAMDTEGRDGFRIRNEKIPIRDRIAWEQDRPDFDSLDDVRTTKTSKRQRRVARGLLCGNGRPARVNESTISRTRHPSTAVAKLKDGRYVMTVDGRQPVSVGMSCRNGGNRYRRAAMHEPRRRGVDEELDGRVATRLDKTASGSRRSIWSLRSPGKQRSKSVVGRAC